MGPTYYLLASLPNLTHMLVHYEIYHTLTHKLIQVLLPKKIHFLFFFWSNGNLKKIHFCLLKSQYTQLKHYKSLLNPLWIKPEFLTSIYPVRRIMDQWWKSTTASGPFCLCLLVYLEGKELNDWVFFPIKRGDSRPSNE